MVLKLKCRRFRVTGFRVDRLGFRRWRGLGVKVHDPKSQIVTHIRVILFDGISSVFPVSDVLYRLDYHQKEYPLFTLKWYS